MLGLEGAVAAPSSLEEPAGLNETVSVDPSEIMQLPDSEGNGEAEGDEDTETAAPVSAEGQGEDGPQPPDQSPPLDVPRTRTASLFGSCCFPASYRFVCRSRERCERISGASVMERRATALGHDP